MARRWAKGSAVLLAAVAAVAALGALALGPLWIPGEAQVPAASEADGSGIDFDGDGAVSPVEELMRDLWLEHPDLSKVLDEAISRSETRADGTIDVSAYLRSIERPWPPERALTEAPLTEATETEGALTETLSSCDPAWMCCFIRGDADRSSIVDMTDGIVILNFLFYGGAAPPNRDAADADDSGGLEQSDAMYIFDHLFSGGPAPPAPYPEPGTDPTYDPVELPCQDRGDLEHDRNPLEEAEILLPPTEDPGLPKDMLPADPTEPIDGTGGFGGLSPDLPAFPAPAGLAWGFRPSYRTRYAERGYEAQPFVLETEAGRGWFTGLPHVVDAGPSAAPRYWIRWSASCVRGYVLASPGVYSGRFTNQTTLVDDTVGANELRLHDLSGKTYVFHGYGESAGAAKGRIKRIEGLGGFTTGQAFERPRIQFFWDADLTGTIHRAEVISPLETTGALVTCQVWHYEHVGPPAHQRISRVWLERPTLPQKVGRPYEVALRHWASGVQESGGTAGDLMEVDVTTDLTATSGDAWPDRVTRRYYYRYFTSDQWNAVASPGYRHQVRYVLGPDAAGDLQESTYRTADVSALADRAATYCEDRRLRTLKVRGLSCGGCGGQGSYTYGWALEKRQAEGQPNQSHIRVHIELPRDSSVDSLRRIICFNPYGQKLIDARGVRESPGSQELFWVRAAEYGTTGSTAWFLRHAFWPSAKAAFAPSAMPACASGPAPPFEGTGSIEGYVPFSYSGKHLEYGYTYPTGGQVSIVTKLGQGKLRSAAMSGVVRVNLQDGYRKRAVTWALRHYVAPYAYLETWFDYGAGHAEDPLALGTYTKVSPAVATARNGSGSPTSESFHEDRLGMLRWRKDEAGRIEYREYDGLTGLISALVRDMDTAAAHPGLTPGVVPDAFQSTGADLIDALSTYAYDALGRLVSFDSPAGLADDNATQLRRTERNVWAKLAGNASNTWSDRPARLAYPHVGGGAPRGEVSIEVLTPGGRTEAVAKAWLPAGTEPYFFADHWTWGDPAERLDQVFAPANRVLLERTEYAYWHDPADDHLVVAERVWTEPESQPPDQGHEVVRHHDAQGRASKVVGRLSSGAGAFREVQMTTHDPLGRPVAWSVGPEGSSLVVVRRAAYDGGEPGGPLVVGDGHATRTVAYTGEASSPDRHVRRDFDWRGLGTAVWHGYDPGAGTAVLIESSPSYSSGLPGEGYDYAGRRIREFRYEGTMAAGNLRALSETLHDELGRVYETRSYGVESNGTVVGTPGAPAGQPIPLATRTWYDARGNVVKRMGPGATFRKYAHDGLGRTVKEYLAYDIAESSYLDSQSVDGDTVLEQSARVLDKAGNTIWLTTCARYPSTPSGALGDLSGMAGSYRRREFHGSWYDVLGRIEVEGFYGDRGSATTGFPNRPVPRPSATGSTVRVTKRSWPETLSGGARRWSASTGVDGQVAGSEVDALGRVVRTWRRPASTNSYHVTDLELDPPGHTVRETIYQAAVPSSAWPAEPPVFNLSGAPFTATAYDWGLPREDPPAGWSNLLGSTGLLALVRLAHPESGEPVAEPVLSYSYNLQGEVRAQSQRNSPSEAVARALTRDARGRTIRDEVTAGWPPGPTALEWEHDALGRLRFARSLDDPEVLDEVEYRYDAWGAVREFLESHDGPVTPEPPGLEKAPRAIQEFEGATMVASGQSQYPIARRQTYRRIARALEGGGGWCFHAASYRDHDAPGSMSHILGRPRYEVGAPSTDPDSEWTEWTEAYRVEEGYLGSGQGGSGRWVKSACEEKQGGQWLARLTQEIPFLTSTSVGLNRFGDPLRFRASRSASDAPFDRLYGYTSSTGRISTVTDRKIEASVTISVSKDTYTFDGFGRLSGYQHAPNSAVAPEGGPAVSQSWGFDGAGNWTCFTGDGACTGSPPASRSYDLRNRIEEIQGDNGAVEYDDAGRIVGHDFATHQVEAAFFYDAWNRLAGYVRPEPAAPVTFRYDALGNLIVRGEPEGVSETHYYHDGSGRRLWRGPADWNAEKTYLRSGGSGRLFGLFGSAHFYVVDPQGSPAGLTSAAGILEARYWSDGTGKPFWYGAHSGNPYNDLWNSNATFETPVSLLGGTSGAWATTHLGCNMSALRILLPFVFPPTLWRPPWGARKVAEPDETEETGAPVLPPGTEQTCWRICQRDVEPGHGCAESVVAALANSIGGQHTFLQCGGNDRNGSPSRGTVCLGWRGGDPGEEVCLTPSKCANCKKDPSTHDYTISWCLAMHKPSKAYHCIYYNCRDWAEEAAKACRLQCESLGWDPTEGQKVIDEAQRINSEHGWLPLWWPNM